MLSLTIHYKNAANHSKGLSEPDSRPVPNPLVDRKVSVEPECVAPVVRPRRRTRKPAAGRANAIWSRREVEAEADAGQELALLRLQRT